MITLNQSYTYEELLRNLQESGTQYPESTIYKKVGESHDERPIPMLRVGSGLDTLILTAGIHGKESINPVLLTRMAQEYCQAYQDNSYIGELSGARIAQPLFHLFSSHCQPGRLCHCHRKFQCHPQSHSPSGM